MPGARTTVGPALRQPLALVSASLLLATLPFITHGLVVMHHVIARGMLGALPSEELQRRSPTSRSRGAAVVGRGHSPCAASSATSTTGRSSASCACRWISPRAERQLDTDPGRRAGPSSRRRMQQSREALEELRALSRGFAPPILLDRGLVAALESLAAAQHRADPASTAGCRGHASSRRDRAQRLLHRRRARSTNAAKHRAATRGDRRLASTALRDGRAPGSTLVVTDDGHGGATRRRPRPRRA